MKKVISILKHKFTFFFIQKRICCVCHEGQRTNLELENGDYICETCAQVMSDSAD